jgi:hypothetical protein
MSPITYVAISSQILIEPLPDEITNSPTRPLFNYGLRIEDYGFHHQRITVQAPVFGN